MTSKGKRNNKMIRHVVLFKLRNDLNESVSAQIFTALKALQHQMPGITNISVGKDISPEGLQRGFTHGFTVDFVDGAARNAYLPHPAHQKVGQMIVAATTGGIDGVLVLDWEI
jgi:Stress responsive A/B Barrel Domain